MSENKEILKDLKQLYFLHKEIRHLEQELLETESKWRRVNLRGGFSSGGGVSDVTGNTAASIVCYTDLINAKVKDLYDKKTECERYIESLDDPVLRTVLRLRFVKFLSWNAVARAVGSRNKSTPYRIVERFFEKD